MTLNEIAKKMCAKGKGILAADESTGTIAKRFKSINVENTEKNRLVFRQTLFSSQAMKNYIGGVILFDETIKQKTTLGPTVPELISKNAEKSLNVNFERYKKTTKISNELELAGFKNMSVLCSEDLIINDFLKSTSLSSSILIQVFGFKSP